MFNNKSFIPSIFLVTVRFPGRSIVFLVTLLLKQFYLKINNYAPFEEEGVYCFAHVCLSVGSVGPQTNLDRSITKELIAQGSYNLVWWLVMTSKWTLLKLRFLVLRSWSQWHCSSKYLRLINNVRTHWSRIFKLCMEVGSWLEDGPCWIWGF